MDSPLSTVKVKVKQNPFGGFIFGIELTRDSPENLPHIFDISVFDEHMNEHIIKDVILDRKKVVIPYDGPFVSAIVLNTDFSAYFV